MSENNLIKFLSRLKSINLCITPQNIYILFGKHSMHREIYEKLLECTESEKTKPICYIIGTDEDFSSYKDFFMQNSECYTAILSKDKKSLYQSIKNAVLDCENQRLGATLNPKEKRCKRWELSPDYITEEESKKFFLITEEKIALLLKQPALSLFRVEVRTVGNFPDNRSGRLLKQIYRSGPIGRWMVNFIEIIERCIQMIANSYEYAYSHRQWYH